MAWWDNLSNRFGDLFGAGGSTNYFQTNPLQGRDYGSSGYMPEYSAAGNEIISKELPRGYNKPTLSDLASAGKRGEDARLLQSGMVPEEPEKGFLEDDLQWLPARPK